MSRKEGKRFGVGGMLAVAWIAFFLIVPLLGIALVSFLSRGNYGEIVRPWTVENYKRLAGFGLLGFDPIHPRILIRSIGMGMLTTLLCLLASVPAAFFISSLRGRLRAVALTFAVIPFWTNLLIRTYGWQALLDENGFVTKLLRSLPGFETASALAPGATAVYLCLFTDYFPFMLLPLYASVAKIDWTIVEAARDLGATFRQTFRHSIWPQILPGAVAGIVMVFLPATGQFVIPDILGGGRAAMWGSLLQQQFGTARDWPFGAALGLVFLILMGFVWLACRKQFAALLRGENT
jgi:spermidine/putrescine transport system permease protein